MIRVDGGLQDCGRPGDEDAGLGEIAEVAAREGEIIYDSCR